MRTWTWMWMWMWRGTEIKGNWKRNLKLDIVTPASSYCSCFTKAYGSGHIFGSGSFLQTANLEAEIDFSRTETLIPLRLRFFTPSEIAKLHGFCTGILFPCSSFSFFWIIMILNQNSDLQLAETLPWGSTLPGDNGVPTSSFSMPKFEFPSDISREQQYRLLGNSLNCVVVSSILNALFTGKLQNFDNSVSKLI